MSLNLRRPRRDWFYLVVAAYTGLHLVLLALQIFDFVTHPLATNAFVQSIAYRWLLAVGVTPLTLTVAVLVLRRAPGNIVGLCLVLMSTVSMGTTLRAGSPLEPILAALGTGWTGLWLLGLYFPDGKPQPARLGGPIRVLSVLSLLANAAWYFFTPTVELSTGLEVPNPVFVEALRPLLGAATGLQRGLLFSVALIIVPSLTWRYRASDLRGQLQLKWFGLSFALLIIPMLPLIIFAWAAGRSDPFEGFEPLIVVFIALYIFVFPTLSVGIAILRHRLYDIDVIIRRTLIYSVLSALLALVYFGGILVLESLFRAITGQGKNPLVIVLSTLAIAALSVPLRSRVQSVIDRRFFRQKYDADRTLAGFATAARDEVDLEHLSAQLVSVIDDTMQPASVSLWLRPSTRGAAKRAAAYVTEDR